MIIQPSLDVIPLVEETHIEKFLIEDRPYEMLSDHFGVSTSLRVKNPSNLLWNLLNNLNQQKDRTDHGFAFPSIINFVWNVIINIRERSIAVVKKNKSIDVLPDFLINYWIITFPTTVPQTENIVSHKAKSILIKFWTLSVSTEKGGLNNPRNMIVTAATLGFSPEETKVKICTNPPPKPTDIPRISMKSIMSDVLTTFWVFILISPVLKLYP